MTIQVWRDQGGQLSKKLSKTSWELGDWLLLGEEFGFSVADAMDATGLNEQTLRNMKCIARAYPINQRIHPLPIGFYSAVAGLKKRDELLHSAVVHSWTRAELRRHARPMNSPAVMRFSVWVPTTTYNALVSLTSAGEPISVVAASLLQKSLQKSGLL